MFGIVIDENGYKVEFVTLNENNIPEGYILKDGESIIKQKWSIANNMLKPKWESTNLEWIEAATEEEIKAWNEKNKVMQKPTEQQTLNAQLLQQNANLQLEIEQQKQLNAQILLQLAGGNANV
ncbi:hypothetical protein [Clostridium butyricum]|uniref:hypothetical protein n=1 Tax=Clostridium butyricum TaxID=1492 RepID=UPI002ABDDE56|nr:hypothetical protein [Clostridium butyricum]